MIRPLLAKIRRVETHTYDHFEAPCAVCKKNKTDHLKLPYLGTEVSVCRTCRTLKYQVFSLGSVWTDEVKQKTDLDELNFMRQPFEIDGVVYRYNPTTGTHERM